MCSVTCEDTYRRPSGHFERHGQKRTRHFIDLRHHGRGRRTWSQPVVRPVTRLMYRVTGKVIIFVTEEFKCKISSTWEPEESLFLTL